MTEKVKSSLNGIGFAFDYISEKKLSIEERNKIAEEAKAANAFVMDYALKTGKITAKDKNDSLINQAAARARAAFDDAKKVNMYGADLEEIKAPFLSRNGAPIPAVDNPKKDDAIIGIANIAFTLTWLAAKNEAKEGENPIKPRCLNALSGANDVIGSTIKGEPFGEEQQNKIAELINVTASLAANHGKLAEVVPYLNNREKELAVIGYVAPSRINPAEHKQEAEMVDLPNHPAGQTYPNWFPDGRGR